MSSEPMTEEQVREAWMGVQRATLVEMRREMHAAGWPIQVVEHVAQLVEQQAVANLERSLPLIMRDLAITAGDAVLH